MAEMFIEVEGGLVGRVWVAHEDSPWSVTIIDHDTEGLDDAEMKAYEAKVKRLDYLRDHAFAEEIY